VIKPNAPRMVTVVVALALLVIGVGLVFFQAQTVEFVRGLPLSRDLMRQAVALMDEQMATWAALAASPILLIVGSLLPGI
jgi:hypothetical protein